MNHRGLKKTDYRPLYWVTGVAILIVAGYFGLVPLRKNYAEKYITTGDEHLNNMQYVEAVVDYKKAAWLKPSETVTRRIELARKSQLDIQELTMFFRQKDNVAMLDMLNTASEVPSSEKEGLNKVQDFLEINQPQIAEIMVKLVLEMDDFNKEAWTYMGIARLQTARIVQMSEQNRLLKLN